LIRSAGITVGLVLARHAIGGRAGWAISMFSHLHFANDDRLLECSDARSFGPILRSGDLFLAA
jgi:hypothetical protein